MLHRAALLACLVAAPALAADVSFTWQTRLLDAVGAVVDGTHDVTLTLYDEGGAVLWQRTSNNVPFTEGYAAIELSGPDDHSPTARLLDEVDFSQTVLLGVTLDGGTELAPRQPLGAVPRAAAAGGRLQVTLGDGVCAGPEDAGALRWEANALQVCNGEDWAIVSAAVPVVQATGGSVSTSGGFTTHTFTSGGSFVVGAQGGRVEVQVLGGGGGGGIAQYRFGNGGGGGGYLRGSLRVDANTTYTVTVGGGGAGRTICGGDNNPPGGPGGSSSFGSLITATGGGGGGCFACSTRGGAGGVASAAAGVEVLASSSGQPGDSEQGDGRGWGGTNGGGSAFGAGAPGVNNSTSGINASGYGNGGSGGHSCQSGTIAGSGSGGVVIVKYPN